MGDKTSRKMFELSNVSVDQLAESPAVHAFMARVASEFAYPGSQELLRGCLAEATANVFHLHDEDGFQIPTKLYELAADVAAKRGR